MKESGPIIGRCMQMCPEEEIRTRERECLLHKLEMIDPTEPKHRARADRSKMVKMFSRSAAGQAMQTAETLRPPMVLVQTINHLLGEVMNNTDHNFCLTYDFISDRIRSVRQDMVIQTLSRGPSISILQPIVKFYAYVAYKLCEESLSNFEPTINGNQLQECIKRLLTLYDDCDLFQDVCNLHGVNLDDYEELYEDARPNIEALYLLHNLGDHEALTRGLGVDIKWRTETFNLALRVSLSYRNQNWIRVCRMIKKLPVLLAATASLHLPAIRRKAFITMSVAYNNKQLKFPMEVLQRLFLYSERKDLINDLKYYSIIYDSDGEYVQFMKDKMNVGKKAVRPRHESFVDDKLAQENVSDLLLFGDL